ncbi:hypothetical protein L228DRAFT_269808 [Xylona heveae TC161]|uniref:Uncharacterized protein n=1 Tax=Xylona heveae (strain CBS 132557 / TC161) TaxID=1328760 RepID=A0A165FVH8_XYLHT|nr:hypothetical protein L228DRAFT_269808 [Xylona heveae TC161]KZF21430.1 hypothetical protein L228DRAFT_269808 [Xylona heveae TC161]
MESTAPTGEGPSAVWSDLRDNLQNEEQSGRRSSRARSFTPERKDRSSRMDGVHVMYPAEFPRRPSGPHAKSASNVSYSVAEKPSHGAGIHGKSTPVVRSYSQDRSASRVPASSRPPIPARSTSRQRRPSLSRPSLSSHSGLAQGLHYRLSQRSMTAPPTMGHDIQPDSPLTFHYRSCQLFQSLEAGSNSGNQPAMHYPLQNSASHGPESLYSRTSHSDFATKAASPALSSHGPQDHYDSTEEQPTNDVPSTVIYWKSPSSRRREYAKIDKSHRGLRGWWTRWAPRWCRGSSRQGFYDQEKNSECGSVRRYRMDLPDEDELYQAGRIDDGDLVDEKKQAPKRDSPKLRRVWSCFGPIKEAESQ